MNSAQIYLINLYSAEEHGQKSAGTATSVGEANIDAHWSFSLQTAEPSFSAKYIGAATSS